MKSKFHFIPKGKKMVRCFFFVGITLFHVLYHFPNLQGDVIRI